MTTQEGFTMVQIVVDLNLHEEIFGKCVKEFNALSKQKSRANMEEMRGISRSLVDMEKSVSALLANERQKIKPDNGVIGRLDYLLKGINVLQAEIVGYNLSLVPKIETDIGSQKPRKK